MPIDINSPEGQQFFFDLMGLRDEGRTTPWGVDLTPEIMDAMRNGEVFTVLDPSGKPHSKICIDPYGQMRQRAITPMYFDYNGERVKIEKIYYQNNNRIALRVFDKDGTPLATLTCNLPDEELAEDEFFVKTWSENGPISEAARQSGLFVDTGRRVQAGYCEAEVWKFKS